MLLRLGFSIAVQVHPEAFLIDQVFAVADQHFQRKCLRRLEEERRSGRTFRFGYKNVVIYDDAERRSHVVRKVNEAEAAVVVRIFELVAEGHGLKKVAHRLNDERALAPTLRRPGGPRGWAPSSVREILHHRPREWLAGR
jgi:Recombinase